MKKNIMLPLALFIAGALLSSSFSKKSANAGDGSTPPTSVVTLYKNKNFTGPTKTLPIGLHYASQLGIGNDALSSIKISPGFAVVLYQDDNFHTQGKTLIVDANSADLGAFNDLTSSIYVYEVGATLYSECGFKGKRVAVPVNGSNDDLSVGVFKMPKGTLSSVKVRSGKILRLFDEQTFGGASVDVTGNVSCLISVNGINFDKRTDSWSISAPMATLYENPGFTGKSMTLGAGSYNILPAPFNNAVSSIKVNSGRVTLYENTNLGSGAREDFFANKATLPISIDNKASSVSVRGIVE